MSRRAMWAAVIAVACGGLYAASENVILPVVLLVFIAGVIVLWNAPKAALYVAFGTACLIELADFNQPDSLTDRVPFFWNINTILQTYAHVNFKAVPLNLFECVLITAGACALFRAVFTQTARVRAGPLMGPICAYLFFVVLALFVGMGSGGDFKIALSEVRAQFYFALVYLMVVNCVRERRHVDQFLWMTAVLIAAKGALYTFRRYVTLGGAPLPDGGVGSHEEAFFFDCYFALLLTLAFCGSHPKLRNFMLLALPLVILGDLATNRRAGTAAMAVILPVLLLAAYRGLPRRRRFISILSLSLIVGFAVYFPVFRNSNSILALPAHALQSQFAPDERDRSSNLYRDAENIDQMTTIQSAPWGFGYGKRFIHAVPIADISGIYELWDVIPHNQILWIWMRTGTIGFFAFWIMISAILVYCARVFRDDTLSLDLRLIGLYALLVVGCQLMFGLLDLQMVNFRDMIFTSAWVGIATRVRFLQPTPGSTDSRHTDRDTSGSSR